VGPLWTRVLGEKLLEAEEFVDAPRLRSQGRDGAAHSTHAGRTSRPRTSWPFSPVGQPEAVLVELTRRSDERAQSRLSRSPG
jgi:hypothetical protein